MAFPENWTQVQVTGRYITPTGEPVSGKVEFSIFPNRRIINPSDGTIIVPETIVAVLNNEGEFTTLLPATNDPDVNPQFSWKVRESFSPNMRFNYYIDVPYDLETLDISHAIELEPDVELQAYVRRSGDSLSGFLILHAHPTNDFHPATKGYVDSELAELSANIGQIGHQTVVHEFLVPSGTWLINHNLNRYPQVSILDENDEVVDSDIIHNTQNQLIIIFAQPLQGKAVLT